MSFQQSLASVQKCTEQQLQDALTFLNIQDVRLFDAMAYSLFNGGKRVRPYLVYSAASTFGATLDRYGVAMAAVEMVHSYSLVHDDLPSMDDDDLRRGKPTCHIQFDEATAILAGDALLTGAFEILADKPSSLTMTQRLELIQLLSRGSGAAGMVAGQAIDLASVGQQVSLQHLQNMHLYKTGALIRSSVLMGATCGDAGAADIQALVTYADAIGLAFQVMDDILDVEGATATLGKQQGADEALNKPTYPKSLGLDGAKDKVRTLHQEALDALAPIQGDVAALVELADYIIFRNH